MTKLRLPRLALLLAVVGWVSGCQRAGDDFGSDAGLLLSLVADVSDACGDPATFAALFADESQASDALRSELSARSFSLEGQPLIDGDTAQLTVAVADIESRPLGQVTWTARRVGAAWKLVQVQLP